MNLPPPKICQLASKLFAQMGSSGKDADVARDKLRQLMEEHGLTWNDLPRILAADIDLAGTAGDAENGDAGPAATQPTADDIPDILGLVLALLEEHASTTAEQRLAIALWILHCWVFDQFVITPRLALLSPVRGCGKTTLLALIELLIPEGNRTDNTTAAAIYYDLDRRPRICSAGRRGRRPRSLARQRIALGFQLGTPAWRQYQPIRRRRAAAVSDICAARDRSDWHAAPAIAAP